MLSKSQFQEALKKRILDNQETIKQSAIQFVEEQLSKQQTIALDNLKDEVFYLDLPCKDKSFIEYAIDYIREAEYESWLEDKMIVVK